MYFAFLLCSHQKTKRGGEVLNYVMWKAGWGERVPESNLGTLHFTSNPSGLKINCQHAEVFALPRAWSRTSQVLLETDSFYRLAPGGLWNHRTHRGNQVGVAGICNWTSNGGQQTENLKVQKGHFQRHSGKLPPSKNVSSNQSPISQNPVPTPPQDKSCFYYIECDTNLPVRHYCHHTC